MAWFGNYRVRQCSVRPGCVRQGNYTVRLGWAGWVEVCPGLVRISQGLAGLGRVRCGGVWWGVEITRFGMASLGKAVFGLVWHGTELPLDNQSKPTMQMQLGETMSTLSVTATGSAPLICHNNQAVNPFNSYSRQMKAITSKRKKTDDDLMALARLEWEAGLYLDGEQPVVPTRVLYASIIAAAKLNKLASSFARAGLHFDATQYVIHHEEEKLSLAERWNEGDSQYVFSVPAKVGTSSVMRTRPIFPDWILDFQVEFDSEQIDAESVATAIVKSGSSVGVGDWRPQKYGIYGTYTADIREL